MDYPLGGEAEKQRRDIEGQVLIPILMDYPLGDGNNSRSGSEAIVLIPILMDYPLGE